MNKFDVPKFVEDHLPEDYRYEEEAEWLSLSYKELEKILPKEEQC